MLSAVMRAIELTALVIIFFYLKKMLHHETAGGPSIGFDELYFLIGLGVLYVVIRIWDVGTKDFSERITLRRILVAEKWPMLFVAVFVFSVGGLLLSR